MNRIRLELTRASFLQQTEWASFVALVKNGKESARNAGDLGLMPGLGRSLEKRIATHASILAWRTPWTEEPGATSAWGLTDRAE